MKFKLLSLLALASLTGVASASPSLTFTASSLGGGLTAYQFTVNGNDALNSSFFIDITFQSASDSSISQIKFAGTDVNDNASATNFNGLLGYSSASDSYFDTPWSGNVVTPPGITQTTTTYGIAAGTGGGSQYSSLPLAQIVSTSPISWTGTLSRNGQNTLVSGSTAVPEPASLGLLSISGAILLVRRRKA